MGTIPCEAAFTADFDISREIPISALVSKIDTDRKQMDVRRGMRSKYVPLRFDPATGAHQIGGRYLFETWDDVLDYMRFTAEELEFEQGVKFWNRPFFSNIDKHAWKVIGAHDFKPPVTHYASRLERFGCDKQFSITSLETVWPEILDDARKQDLAGVWLLTQPDERQIGILSVATQLPGTDMAERASTSLGNLEKRPSLIRHVPGHMSFVKLFDRASLNLSLWLPRSPPLGGDASIFPTFPIHPLPSQTSEIR